MIETFIRRPVFTTMFILVLIVFGIRSYPGLGVDLYPDVDLPMVGVTVTYEGTAPEEMETLVTKPIENRVSQVSGIKTITSSIREGYSQTVLEFEIGTDPRQMASEVREKVAGVRRRLPDDIDEPVVQRFDMASQAIATYAFSSDKRSPGEVRRILNDVVIDGLQMLEGVADVSVYGAADRAIKVHVKSEKLKQYDISFQTVLTKVNNANINTPGGKVRDNNNTITVRTMGKLNTVDDFKQIIVANKDGKAIRLTEIADVEDDWEDAESYSRTNGVPSVMLAIRKQSRTNTVQVIDVVNKELEKIMEHDLPPDIKMYIVRDQSRYIRENVADVWNTILFGGFLALLITYMFLGDLRATIIGGLAIPTSIIATFFLMDIMGFTLNNMSLMGLSLAVGFLIDDAIVLVENIFRHMEMGKKPFVASADATKELVLAILATSMSLMAVFVPIGSMGETIGQFFKQFGLTVAFALA
ncbi:MAG: efflux RND transporter permease subunit, partial [Acidaminococcaceae bacterium]|nr:efflux RND transporter permease subunit [Acidaminococcaceae bacterium]